jgi:hypothetical protein
MMALLLCDKLQVLKCPFMLKVKRILKFMKLCPMILANLCCCLIFFNMKIRFHELMKGKQQLQFFSIVQVICSEFGKQMGPKSRAKHFP